MRQGQAHHAATTVFFLSAAGERHGIRGSGDLPWAVRLSSLGCQDEVEPAFTKFSSNP